MYIESAGRMMPVVSAADTDRVSTSSAAGGQHSQREDKNVDLCKRYLPEVPIGIRLSVVWVQQILFSPNHVAQRAAPQGKRGTDVHRIFAQRIASRFEQPTIGMASLLSIRTAEEEGATTVARG